MTITGEAPGYPIRSLSKVPPGDYYVQAVLNIYQTFHRANGTTVKLAPDRGEGQHWNLAPRQSLLQAGEGAYRRPDQA